MKESINVLYSQTSSGNKDAYERLLQWFTGYSVLYSNYCSDKLGIYCFKKDEFNNDIFNLFTYVVRNYSEGCGSFKKFCVCVIYKRVPELIYRNLITKDKQMLSLDAPDSDGFTLYDRIASDEFERNREYFNRKITYNIMASKKIASPKIDNELKKILDYKDKGYRKNEIMRLMNLTDGQYRYLLRILSNFTKGNIDIL